MTESLNNKELRNHFAYSTLALGADGLDGAKFNPQVISILAERREQFLRYLQRRLGDRDIAEDVLQDFHMKVLQKANQIKDANSTVAWLRTVLRSVLMDYFRSAALERHAYKQMEADLTATLPTQEVAVAEERDFDREACTCFYELLPTLKTEYADVLCRVDLEQQSRTDVARALGTTTGNVRVRLYRARRALKEVLKQSCLQCREHHCFGHNEPSDRVD